LDDLFASIALKNKDAIFARNRNILLKNREILDKWVQGEKHISYVRPEAGTTALLYYDFDIPSKEFCIELMKKTGIMFTPGECFELEGCVRIGYAFDSKELEVGLNKFSEYLATL
jgi:aspartate/methionine/tyrosine aminotransferase